MKTVGIICEYNPLHAGHKKQIDTVRRICGEETAVVCLMSGNFVQRGAPAIIDKSLRAKAAILSGADLVLELPTEYALSSAEGFAAGGVRILGDFCDYLCFGAENPEQSDLMLTAAALLSDTFSELLRDALETGVSFPAARQAALEKMGLDGNLLATPNNILAVEYCKAILSQDCGMRPLPIQREGSYHDTEADQENPSATAIRSLMLGDRYWKCYVPGEAVELFENAHLHDLRTGERAVLAKLRTMTDEEFEALPYGSEGLWRKFMHACRECATLDEIIAATKSKRYTHTRITRMVMCAFLGLSEADLSSPVPYTRVLALNDRGRTILKAARETGTFLNAGEHHDSDYCRREYQIGDLYGLFALDNPEAPSAEAKRRIIYLK
ncbi:MAG: nucleotidyltransferase family protein [Oscillospiraceae bacterium]|nr:nucleotidyltransferase family protein [Oscillospiraceae bacterium]